LVQVTPGPWIHLGADEVFSIAQKEYCTFLQQAASVIESLGKRMIGWDDLGDCDFQSNFVVQWWRNWEDGEKKVRAAVDRGHLVIMSPAKMTYMDMKYNQQTTLGQSSVGYIEVDKTYQWHPETVLPGVDKNSILGIEGPCWTEFIYTQDDLDYMVFPRAIALAEIGWVDMPQRNWQDFRKRLLGHYDRLQLAGVNFYKSPVVDNANAP
jgi:hexosaminidase